MWNVVWANVNHWLGPMSERSGALLGREKRRLPPNAERVQPLFGLPASTSILVVHVHTVGTTVHRLGTELNQFQQEMLDPPPTGTSLQWQEITYLHHL